MRPEPGAEEPRSPAALTSQLGASSLYYVVTGTLAVSTACVRLAAPCTSFFYYAVTGMLAVSALAPVLSRRVYRLHMAAGRVVEDCVIGGEQRSSPMTGGSDDEPISGIGVEAPRQTHAIERYRGRDRQQVDASRTENRLRPGPDLQRETEPALLDQQGDFPRCDGRYSDTSRSPRLLDHGPGGRAKPLVALHGPDQYVRVEQDHREADQSDAEAAGSKGSSYSSTVPRIIPMNAGSFSFDPGIGDNTATGRPRLVIVTGWPSLFISLMMRRHFALNSAAETCLAVISLSMSNVTRIYR